MKIKNNSLALSSVLLFTLLVVLPFGIFSVRSDFSAYIFMGSAYRLFIDQFKDYFLFLICLYFCGVNSIYIRSFFSVSNPLVGLFALYFIFSVNSVLVGRSELYVIVQTLAYLVISLGIYSTCTAFIFNNKFFLLARIVASSFVVVLFAIFLEFYLFGDSAVAWSNRWFGITANPNHLATYSLLNHVIFYLCYRQKCISGRLFACLCALSVFVGYLSGSRLFVVGLLLFYFLYGSLKVGRRYLSWMLTVSFFVVFIFIIFGSVSDLFNIFGGDTRVIHWLDALNSSFSSPFGANDTGNIVALESSFISLFYNFGFPLAFAFLSVFILNLYGQFRNSNSEMFICYFIFIIICFFEGVLLARSTFPLFFMCLFYCLYLNRKVFYAGLLLSRLNKYSA